MYCIAFTRREFYAGPHVLLPRAILIVYMTELAATVIHTIHVRITYQLVCLYVWTRGRPLRTFHVYRVVIEYTMCHASGTLQEHVRFPARALLAQARPPHWLNVGPSSMPLIPCLIPLG